MSAMSDLAIHQSPTMRTIPTDSVRREVHVDHHVDYGAGLPIDPPLPLVRLTILGEGYHAAYLTVTQARVLAAALHVAAYRATSEAQGDA